VCVVYVACVCVVCMCVLCVCVCCVCVRVVCTGILVFLCIRGAGSHTGSQKFLCMRAGTHRNSRISVCKGGHTHEMLCVRSHITLFASTQECMIGNTHMTEPHAY